MAEAPKGSVVQIAAPSEASEAPAAPAEGAPPPSDVQRLSQAELRKASTVSLTHPKASASRHSRASKTSRGSRKRSRRSRPSEPPPLQDSYGGIAGPNSAFLRLVSSDDHEFLIERRYTEVSGRIKRTLNNQKRHIADDEPNEIHFPGVPSHILSRVCQYFVFKVYYTFSGQEVEEFPIPFEIALQLLMTATYLDC